MRPLLPLGLAALLAAPAAAGTSRVAEIAPLTGESATARAPTITLAAPGLTLAPIVPLAPAGLAASISPQLSAATPAAALKASALTAAPVVSEAKTPLAALTATVDGLGQAAASKGDQAPTLNASFDGSAHGGGAVIAGESATPGATLEPATPREKTGRSMPPGVKRAFQNSGVLGGGMAALFAALYASVQSIAPQATLAQFAVLALPIALIPLHFALVSAFWAGRYYGYPRLGAEGKALFRRAWNALSFAYPAAALGALAWWLDLMRDQPLVLLTMGLPLLVALGEVTHHFLYRLQAERAQDRGRSLLDWRDRLGGNIGQQLRRMRGRRL